MDEVPRKDGVLPTPFWCVRGVSARTDERLHNFNDRSRSSEVDAHHDDCYGGAVFGRRFTRFVTDERTLCSDSPLLCIGKRLRSSRWTLAKLVQNATDAHKSG